jgi:hypothetical protein
MSSGTRNGSEEKVVAAMGTISVIHQSSFFCHHYQTLIFQYLSSHYETFASDDTQICGCDRLFLIVRPDERKMYNQFYY